jgi:hypothetical protein
MRGVLTIAAATAVLAACGGAPKAASKATPEATPKTANTTAAPTATPSIATRTATAPPKSPAPAFTATVSKPTAATLKYSWRSGCPVPVSHLRTITLTYWGMDHAAHTGRLVVNTSAVAGLTKVFHKLFDNRYPIRRMVPVDAYKGSDFDSIEADNTSAFNCRNATGSSTWSQHAYGLAVDVNPCENPYIPAGGSDAHPRCRKYDDRSRHDPGLIHKGDATVRAFASIGWGWGGSWSGAKDYQHFSSNGR